MGRTGSTCAAFPCAARPGDSSERSRVRRTRRPGTRRLRSRYPAQAKGGPAHLRVVLTTAEFLSRPARARHEATRRGRMALSARETALAPRSYRTQRERSNRLISPDGATAMAARAVDTSVLFGPAMVADPYSAYARLRAADPVHWHAPMTRGSSRATRTSPRPSAMGGCPARSATSSPRPPARRERMPGAGRSCRDCSSS
jgi:hypothetical protein